MTISKILLPLRSNAGWFTNEHTRSALESRLKNYFVFCDELVLEDGRVTFVAGDGSAVEGRHPPGTIEDRRRIRYFAPGEPYSGLISTEDGAPVLDLGGIATVRYEVDFYPILSDAGLLGADGISWADVELTPEAEDAARVTAPSDSQHPELQSVLPDNRFVREQILGSLYHDAVFAYEMRLPFVVDEHVQSIVAWASALTRQSLREDLRSVALTEWLGLGLPDFTQTPWDQVLRIRESAPGRDLRSMISRVTAALVEDLPNIRSQEDVQSIARKYLVRELVEEVVARRTGVRDLVLNLGLNFIPLGPAIASVLSGGVDVQRLIQERQSWVSLLKRDYYS